MDDPVDIVNSLLSLDPKGRGRVTLTQSVNTTPANLNPTSATIILCPDPEAHPNPNPDLNTDHDLVNITGRVSQNVPAEPAVNAIHGLGQTIAVGTTDLMGDMKRLLPDTDHGSASVAGVGSGGGLGFPKGGFGGLGSGAGFGSTAGTSYEVKRTTMLNVPTVVPIDALFGQIATTFPAADLTILAALLGRSNPTPSPHNPNPNPNPNPNHSHMIETTPYRFCQAVHVWRRVAIVIANCASDPPGPLFLPSS